MCTAMDTPPCSTETQDDFLAKIDSRKSNKPLMEKKRRQRINRCLNDLKSLVLEGMKKDPSRYSKLEKADILEMTVRHVQTLHRHEGVGCRLGGGGRLLGNGRSMGGDSRTKYRAGFIHCAVEVTRYLAGLNGVPHDLHHRLISHLNTVTASLTCVPGMGQLPGASVAVGGGVVTVASPAARPDSSVTTATDQTSPVPHTPGGPYAVSYKSSPPVVLSGSAVAPPLATSTSVSLVPARLSPQQTMQVLHSTSSSVTSVTHTPQPRPLPLPAPPPVLISPDLGLNHSEKAAVPQNSEHPRTITLVATEDESRSNQACSSFVSSGTFPPRILPLTNNTLTSSCESVTSSTSTTHVDQNEGSATSTPVITPYNQGHAATSNKAAPLSAPALPSPESQDKITSPSWAAPLDFQVSVKLSSAASTPALSVPIWSSPVLVRPTPTLPTGIQRPSTLPLLSPSSLSSSSSSTTSSSSFSPSSSSSPGASALPARVSPQSSNASPSPSCNTEQPLNLAIHHHQEPGPRPTLKILSSLPCARPAPYPVPRCSSPRPSEPWRPW